MLNVKGDLIDTFSLPGYNPPDAAPASVAQENQKVVETHTIPPALWMVFFLVAGYIGLRWIMED